MANRNLAPIKGSLRRNIVILNGSFTVGAVGALTQVGASGKAGFTCAKTAGTGDYTVTLQDAWSDLHNVIVTMVTGASPASTGGIDPVILTMSASGKAVTFSTYTKNGAFTTAHPPSGATICIAIHAVDGNI